MLRKNFALVHVGNKAASAFMEADQYTALFHHQTRRPSRPLAISLRRTIYLRIELLCPFTALMPQVGFKYSLLGGHLCGRVEMLHAATPAHTEMRTPRLHPIG